MTLLDWWNVYTSFVGGMTTGWFIAKFVIFLIKKFTGVEQ